jgi:esterase/lipase superfamily enzyme
VPVIERPWVLRVPYFQYTVYEQAEDPAKHFTIKEIAKLTREELLRLVRERLAASSAFKDHAIVFVHGFNTSFDNAIYRTAQLAYDLKFDGAPFAYSWPSKGQLGLQDYNYDRESAGQAEPHLKSFLELVVTESGARHVSIIAHSMGNQALLPALRDIKRALPADVVLHQLVLAAPDVDRDNFEFLAREIEGVSRGITLYAAANDRALAASRRYAGGVPRAGDVPQGGPVVVPGVDTIDVTATSTEMLALNHAGFAEKTALLNDLQLLIQTGERPPHRRIPILERIATERGEYWRYPRVR